MGSDVGRSYRGVGGGGYVRICCEAAKASADCGEAVGGKAVEIVSNRKQFIETSRETMAHALGEMYYLAGLMEERRQKRAEPKGQQEQGPQTHPGLVFISPRVPKEFDTVVPSDTGKSVVRTVDSADEWCVIA